MAVSEQAAAGEQRPRATESTPLLTPQVADGAQATATPPSPPSPPAVSLSESDRPLRPLLEHGGSSGGPSHNVRSAQSLPTSPAMGWRTWSPFRERPPSAAIGRMVGRGDAGGDGRGGGGRSRRGRRATDTSTSRRWGDSRRGGRGSLHATILGAMARAESSGVRPSVSERYMVPVVEEEADAAAAAARSLAATDDGGRADGSPGAGALSSECSWPRLAAAAADDGSDVDARVGGRGGMGNRADGSSVNVGGCAVGDADDTDGSDVDVKDDTVYATVVDVGASIVERRFGVHELAALIASLRAPMPRSTAVRWIHVNGVCDGPGGSALLDTLSGVYGLHPLACEDVLMTPQRPKVEQYEVVEGEGSGILTASDDDKSEAGTGGAEAAAIELAADRAAASANGGGPWARTSLYNTAESDGSGNGGYGGGASLFVVCHSHELGGDESGYALMSNQVSLFLLADASVVISFQESAGASPQSGAWLARVRAALTATVLSRGRGALPDAAHIVYLVMDAVVDQLFVLCEFFGFRVDELEGALLAECGAVVVGGAVDEESAGGRLAGAPVDSIHDEGSARSAVSAAAPTPPPSGETPATLLAAILRLRRDLLALRRTVWPLRDVLSKLLLLVPESGGGGGAAGRGVDSTASMGSDGVGGIVEASRAGGGGHRGRGVRRGRDVRPFLRDVMDHTLQVVDILESYRSVVGGLMELYLGNANNRMQEIMKTLTVVVR
ncbi:hypothetical protein MMPV_007071 [Pyropia vietnamensis]